MRGHGSQASTHYGVVTHQSGGPGQLQGDSIRNITGRFGGHALGWYGGFGSGPFYSYSLGDRGSAGNGIGTSWGGRFKGHTYSPGNPSGKPGCALSHQGYALETPQHGESNYSARWLKKKTGKPGRISRSFTMRKRRCTREVRSRLPNAFKPGVERKKHTERGEIYE